MKKPIIGIICQPFGWQDNSVFTNRYYILDNYSQVIMKNGGIPIGIIMNDLELIEDSLKLCDGFLITGGIAIKDYHLKVIDYALKNNKPLLGICMGMQALALYSLAENKEEKGLMLIPQKHIHNDEITQETKQKTIHKVNIIKKNSHLYQIFKKDQLEVNSFHNYQVKKVGKNFEIVGKSTDGIIEIIEHIDKNKFIVGVQWHPELLDSMQPLIKTFIEKSRINEN